MSIRNILNALFNKNCRCTEQKQKTIKKVPEKVPVINLGGCAIDEVLSKRHGTYNKFGDKHSVRWDGDAIAFSKNVNITGKDANNPVSITMTDTTSGNVYRYIKVCDFKDKSKLKKEYGDKDYILVSATKPDGTNIKLNDHYEVYRLDVKEYDFANEKCYEYKLIQPKGYHGSGRSSVNIVV